MPVGIDAPQRVLATARRHRYRLAVGLVAGAAAIAIWIVSTALFPYHSLNHDEGVYLQQAAMVLEGQLRVHPPVAEGFRPWFFVDGPDGLYPKYAPVPAAIFALGELVGSYRLALPAIGAGLVAGVAAVGRELFDRRVGLAAAVLFAASPLFLVDTAVFLPYAPTALLEVAFAAASLRADRRGDPRWGAVAGAAIGLAAFARPFTALLFALPFVAHALWTIYRAPREALPRQLAILPPAIGGVALALEYNAVLTGSALEFPYEAFAPLDGPGFGYREILGHGVTFTPERSARASWAALAALVDRWIVGGPLGLVLALGGLLVAARRAWSARVATVAALPVTVIGGNLAFWGTYNVVGDVDRAGDGLIAALGPYYHFDLLVPIAIFGAVAVVAGLTGLRDRLAGRLERRQVRATLAGVAIVGAALLGGVTLAGAAGPIDHNARATATYEEVYAPLEEPPAESVVLLPTPYGPWLGHPFQALRNDPGFDGETLYATDDRPFAVADALPDRSLYRLGIRGPWDPLGGSPEGARLQRVETASGETVRLGAEMGVSSDARSVTVTVESGADRAHWTAPTEPLSIGVGVGPDRLRVDGPLSPVGDAGRDPLASDEPVVVTVFVDRPGGGFAYRLELPVDVEDDRVRALTPHVEYCVDARACDGAATYLPDRAPDGVSVTTTLHS